MTKLFLCRHGETEWSRDGKHTGVTDLPLTSKGEEEARALARRIKGCEFDLVLTSPLLRARQTCELAGFTGEPCPEAVEWNYGDYEGLTTLEIHKSNPGWTIFKGEVRMVSQRPMWVLAPMRSSQERSRQRAMWRSFRTVIFSACWSPDGSVWMQRGARRLYWELQRCRYWASRVGSGPS